MQQWDIHRQSTPPSPSWDESPQWHAHLQLRQTSSVLQWPGFGQNMYPRCWYFPAWTEGCPLSRAGCCEHTQRGTLSGEGRSNGYCEHTQRGTLSGEGRSNGYCEHTQRGTLSGEGRSNGHIRCIVRATKWMFYFCKRTFLIKAVAT